MLSWYLTPTHAEPQGELQGWQITNKGPGGVPLAHFIICIAFYLANSASLAIPILMGRWWSTGLFSQKSALFRSEQTGAKNKTHQPIQANGQINWGPLSSGPWNPPLDLMICKASDFQDYVEMWQHEKSLYWKSALSFLKGNIRSDLSMIILEKALNHD